MGRAAWVVSLLCASCVSTSSNICEDGSYCPGGFVCDELNDRCLLPEQIAACVDKLEGEACVYEAGPGSCRAGACVIDFCGDGYVNGNGAEACDGDSLGVDPRTGMPNDCTSLGFYGVEGLACTSSCGFEKTGCEVHGWCGDLTVNGQELCDGPQTRMCIAIGFDAGTTSCNLQCGFTIADCSRFGWNPESLADVEAHAVAGTARDDQWAVGANGRAMRFEGAFWNSVPTGVTNTLIRAWSNAKDDTWALGQARTSPPLPAVVIRWDGQAWSQVAGVPQSDYVDIWGAGAGAIYIATPSSVLAYDGTSWGTVGTFTGEPIAIRGTSPNDLWVATRAGPLMRWTGSWQDVSPPGASIQFLDANAPDDVWAIGHATADPGTGVIAHWNGTSWTQWVTAQEIYNVIASSSPNDTWVGGVDGIMRHWDGVAWSRSTNIGASPSGLAALSGLLSLGPSDVVGVSTLELAYRYRGQAYGTVAPLGPNPFDATQNLAAWGPANDLFVTNVKGEVWRFDGVAWSPSFTVPQVMGADQPARGLWGSSPSDVWVAANDGRVYHYDGATWSPHDVSTVPLQQVWGSGPGAVWAFGGAGAFEKTGATWTRHALGGGRILGVSGSGPADIWAVEDGSPNKLWRWDGASWGEMDTGASTPVLAVAAVAPDDVHVSAGGSLLHWNGSSWSETVVPVLADLTFMTATAADDVIAASERDLVHYNGTTWSAMRTPIDFVPNTSDFIPMIGLQASPGRIDMLLQRYRIRTLIRTRPLVCRPSEACGDAVDNDCDGKLDALDSDCP